jgi:hypothetical protein
MLAKQFENVVDDRVLHFDEQVRLREGGFRNAGAGLLRRNSVMMLWGACLAQRPFRSSTSTIAAISHMLEMVASSMVMVSRLGRSSLAPSSPFHHPWRRIGYILDSKPAVQN